MIGCLTLRHVENEVLRCYGIACTASPLDGERDRNFRLRCADGRERVLKVGNRDDDPLAVDLQTAALLHVAAADPELEIPRVCPTLAGDTACMLTLQDGTSATASVLTYLPGELLFHVRRSAGQRRNLGSRLARLDRAFRGFEHPAASRTLLWDMQRCADLRPMVEQIEPAADRSLAERYIDVFERFALPVLGTLRAQVIHNDANLHNVLCDPDQPDVITGILDFGDIVRAPLVIDVAVAACYQISTDAHPLEAPAELAEAYHARSPLLPDEVDILCDLIATRLVMTVAITGWRARRWPGNQAYILRNDAAARIALQRLATLTRAQSQRYIRDRLT